MSRRKEKLTEAFKVAAGDFINRHSNRTSLITVTGIILSADGRRGTVLVTVLPETEEKSAIQFLRRKRDEFREFAGVNLRTRVLPTFDFTLDLGEKNRQKLDRISMAGA